MAGEHILFVENDPNQREAYRQILDDEGYHVVTAAEGREAVDMLKKGQQHIDLVVTDISMPGMDGIELIGKVLGLDPCLPIIVHTAYAQYKDNFMTWQAEHYIIKDSDPTELLKKIAETLKRKKGA